MCKVSFQCCKEEYFYLIFTGDGSTWEQAVVTDVQHSYTRTKITHTHIMYIYVYIHICAQIYQTKAFAHTCRTYTNPCTQKHTKPWTTADNLLSRPTHTHPHTHAHTHACTRRQTVKKLLWTWCQAAWMQLGATGSRSSLRGEMRSSLSSAACLRSDVMTARWGFWGAGLCYMLDHQARPQGSLCYRWPLPRTSMIHVCCHTLSTDAS